MVHAAAIIVPSTGSLDTLLGLFIAATTLAAPASGLILVAALTPIGRADTIAAAFLAGWVLRGMPDRSGPRVAAPLAAWLFCALVAGSTLGVYGEPDGLAAGTRFVLAVALVAATVRMFRWRPAQSNNLPAAMAAGASVALALAMIRDGTIDWPAAAALFGLVACLAAGMSVRAHGRARLVWAAASIWLFAGVVFAANRSPQMLSAFNRTRPLIDATLQATAENPWFGIGIGRDRTTTPLFYPSSIASDAPASHNLLAIGAELGLVGLALWVIWIGAGLVRAARALNREAGDVRLWGATAGVVFYVAALAVSRPLAFSETLFPFMIQFGLMTGLAGSTLLDGTPAWTRRPRWQVAAAVLAMAGVAAGALESARRFASARERVPAKTRIESTPAAGAAIPRSR